MRASTLIAALFASSALAAPLQANKVQERALEYHTEVKVVTVYVTEGNLPAPTPVKKHKSHRKPKPYHPKPTPAPAPAPQPAPAPAPQPAPAPAPQPAPAPAPQPAPAPAPYPAPAPAPAGGNDMLNVANKWRKAYGLPQLAWSDDCASNAQKTGEMNGGSRLEHHKGFINGGQVISPGAADNFEMVYVGGWLCEVPSDGPIASICKKEVADLHIDHTTAPTTGHHDILNDPGYSKIGCHYTPDASGATPFYDVWGGQWVCNMDR